MQADIQTSTGDGMGHVTTQELSCILNLGMTNKGPAKVYDESAFVDATAGRVAPETATAAGLFSGCVGRGGGISTTTASRWGGGREGVWMWEGSSSWLLLPASSREGQERGWSTLLSRSSRAFSARCLELGERKRE